MSGERRWSVDTDEMVEAALGAIKDARGALDVDTDGIPDSRWRILARAVLSVPALAEVIARDAKVREIVGEWATVSQIVRHSPSDQAMAKIVAAHLGAVDDSDIMPGSEFDGPVVL